MEVFKPVVFNLVKTSFIFVELESKRSGAIWSGENIHGT